MDRITAIIASISPAFRLRVLRSHTHDFNGVRCTVADCIAVRVR